MGLLAMAQTTTNIQKSWGGLAPQPPPPLGGGCPIETLDFSEFSRHLWQFPSKNQALWPAGLLLLAAHCCLPWPKQPPTFKNLGGLGPPATPPLGGWLSHRNPRNF